MNMYDIRLRDTAPYQMCGRFWPDSLAPTTQFLQQKHVLEALNVPSNSIWTECSDAVYGGLIDDNSPHSGLVQIINLAHS
jgi:hypothetical protein